MEEKLICPHCGRETSTTLAFIVTGSISIKNAKINCQHCNKTIHWGTKNGKIIVYTNLRGKEE